MDFELTQSNLEGLTLEELNEAYQTLTDMAAKKIIIESILSLADSLEVTSLKTEQ